MRNLKTLFIIVSIISIACIILGCLNYSGVCISKGRTLTDKERIRISLDKIINTKSIYIEKEDSYNKYYTQIPYESVDQYLELNPDCCQITHGGDLASPKFIDRITGYNANKVIVINYLVHYIKDGIEKTQWIKSEGFQTNCGMENRLGG